MFVTILLTLLSLILIFGIMFLGVGIASALALFVSQGFDSTFGGLIAAVLYFAAYCAVTAWVASGAVLGWIAVFSS